MATDNFFSGLPRDITRKVMTQLHGEDKASAARAAPAFAAAYRDTFTAEDYWHACGQADKPERLRVPHCAQRREETST